MSLFFGDIFDALKSLGSDVRALTSALQNHTKALQANTEGVLKLALSTDALTQAAADNAAAGVALADAVTAATAGLDDLATKLAAAIAQIGTVDPAVQAALDNATSGISNTTASLNAAAEALKQAVVRDDPPAPPQAGRR